MSFQIFVVEDNESDVFLLRRALTALEEEFEMEIAADGEQAIKFVHAQRTRTEDLKPCVILLDLHLPRYGGIEVLRVIRQEPVMSHLHVVVTTSVASPQEAADLRELGAYYRPKPKSLVEFTELAAELIAICKGSHVAA